MIEEKHYILWFSDLVECLYRKLNVIYYPNRKEVLRPLFIYRI